MGRGWEYGRVRRYSDQRRWLPEVKFSAAGVAPGRRGSPMLRRHCNGGCGRRLLVLPILPPTFNSGAQQPSACARHWRQPPAAPTPAWPRWLPHTPRLALLLAVRLRQRQKRPGAGAGRRRCRGYHTSPWRCKSVKLALWQRRVWPPRLTPAPSAACRPNCLQVEQMAAATCPGVTGPYLAPCA